MTTPGDNTKEWNFAFIDADFDFIKTMQISILDGRNFSPEYAADRNDFDEKYKIQSGRKMAVYLLRMRHIYGVFAL